MKTTLYTSLFALPSLLSFSAGLPFASQKHTQLEALAIRAKYSVVAVDGGRPASTGEDGLELAPATIIQTVYHTAPQATKTIIDKSPTTNYISIIKTIETPESTKTLLLTTTPPPTTVTTTGYSIINVIAPPVTVEVPAPLPTTSAATSPVSVTAFEPSILSSATSERLSSQTTLLASITSSTTTSPNAIPTFSIYTSSFSSAITATSLISSTTTHDDGQWHTTYPSWSNRTQTWDGAVKRHAEPTPLLV